MGFYKNRQRQNHALWVSIRIARGDSNRNSQHMILRRSTDFFFTNPGFPPFFYTLGANLPLLLYGDVPVMFSCVMP